METAVAWALAISAILIGIGAAIFWGSGSKLIGLWAGFVPGAIVFVLACGFQFHHLIAAAGAEETKPIDAQIAQTRAYVVLDQITADWGKDVLADSAPITAWRFTIRWKNTGLTPAKDFRSRPAALTFNAKGMPPGWNDAPLVALDTPPITLGREQPFDVGNVELPIQVVKDLAAGKIRAYLWVSSTYRDVFDNTPVRHNDFAVEIKVTGDVTAPGSPFRFEGVKQHFRVD